MARYIGPVCRLCRREAVKLFLKGERCYTEKCPIGKKTSAPPGQHGLSRKKVSEYGVQLREKQKARRAYGVLENQFRRYFARAARAKGVTGVVLLQFLERRLDNVVYRMGFASSRPEARQLVRHGHFTVNGHRVSIPSYLVDAGDAIAVHEKSRSKDRFKGILEATRGRTVPEWLSVKSEALEGSIARLPAREDVDLPVEEHLIVELYSR